MATVFCALILRIDGLTEIAGLDIDGRVKTGLDIAILPAAETNRLSRYCKPRHDGASITKWSAYARRLEQQLNIVHPAEALVTVCIRSRM